MTIEPRRRQVYNPELLIPNPDPTEVTVRIIEAAKQELRSEFKSALEAAKAEVKITIESVSNLAAFRYSERGHVLETFEGYTKERHEEDIRFQGIISEVIKERFNGVAIQFAGIRDRFSERDMRAVVAMNAAGEAIRKSETQFGDRISSLESMQNTTRNTLSDRINELSSRIDRGYGNQEGKQAATSSTQGNVGMFIGIAVFISSVVIAAVGYIGHTSSTVPIVGADTQRVTDLITQMTAAQQDMNQRFTSAQQDINQRVTTDSQATNARLDALSQRINGLTPPTSFTTAPIPTLIPPLATKPP